MNTSLLLRNSQRLLPAAIVATAFALSGAYAYASPKNANKLPAVNVASISQYVYPDNAPESPGSFTFAPDGESYLMMNEDGTRIVRFNTITGSEMETVFDASHTRENTISSADDFILSPDGTKLLIKTDSKPIYRRSESAKWYIFEIKRNILRQLSKNHDTQQSPLFSPDARMVAFVSDNNIYIKKIDYDSEVSVTTDGSRNSIINGVPDWTYEEEFSTNCSMVWAPDCSMLCYLRYDEKKVPLYSFPLYRGWCNPQEEYTYYPGNFTYKYPVAGEPNSVVSLHSYDVETRKIKELPLSDPKIEYIPRIAFGDTSDRLMAVTLNRAQNRMEIYSVNPRSTVAKSILVQQAKAWLNPDTYQAISFENDGFVVLSEDNGYANLLKYSYTGQQLKAITNYTSDVTAYYGHDLPGNIYYQMVPQEATPSASLNRIICKVDKTGKKTEIISLPQGWASATFSPECNYYILNQSDANTPPVYTLFNSKGKKIRVLEDNAAYSRKTASMARKEFFTLTSDGYTLNGYMVKPGNFNPSGKYPVIMWQYSGPGSQEVKNRWQLDWERYAAEKDFVVVCVDGRGTGARGSAFRDVVYKRLGYYETIDQIAAANYVASQPWADASRIGICGWSYGGYETLMAVTDLEAPYAAAVAIAPVSSWRFYDTVYAERYMLTPQENADGYNEASALKRASRLACPLLIMHGTSDDNVHLQNTIAFSSALQEADRYCSLWLFPGMNHSINSCDARALVYGRMINFFVENL